MKTGTTGTSLHVQYLAILHGTHSHSATHFVLSSQSARGYQIQFLDSGSIDSDPELSIIAIPTSTRLRIAKMEKEGR